MQNPHMGPLPVQYYLGGNELTLVYPAYNWWLHKTIAWTHFLHQNILGEISLISLCGLQCKCKDIADELKLAYPLCKILAWAHSLHHSIQAITLHWPIQHTMGCPMRLSHGPAEGVLPGKMLALACGINAWISLMSSSWPTAA